MLFRSTYYPLIRIKKYATKILYFVYCVSILFNKLLVLCGKLHKHSIVLLLETSLANLQM